MHFKAVTGATLALLAAACFGGPGVPDQLFTLTAEGERPAAAAARSAAEGEAITFVEPTVPRALETNRVPVYVDATTIQYLEGAYWVENPAPLFGRLVGEIVAARTGRVVLDAGQFTHDPGTRLTGQLLEFGLDAATMDAIAVYDVAIAREGGGITANRFAARVPVAEATAAAVAPALNRAANQVAEQVAAWIGG